MSASTRLERLGQVMFAVMCLAVSAAAVQHVFASRSAAAPARPVPVAAGKKLTLPDNATSRGTRPALLLALNSQCRFCTESMPFYRRLAESPAVREGRLLLSAVTMQPEAEMQTYVSEHRLPVSAIVPIAEAGFNVPGTPVLLLVNADGTVHDSWSGWLDAEGEKAVESSIARVTRR
jgi:hypothetical protein